MANLLMEDSRNQPGDDKMGQDSRYIPVFTQDCTMTARILVVDNEPMVRALIARALTDEGYEVVAVANGRAALDAARSAEVSFDLIITNNYMPGLTGAELVARVRLDFPDLPILHVDDIGRRKRINDLPNDVPTIYKPFSIAGLREAVRRLLTVQGS
ncbi:MAG TPA: response regulator [Gemmatimonadales bacterium]|nr:response regulator [Gemmatimonadales bacterium]